MSFSTGGRTVTLGRSQLIEDTSWRLNAQDSVLKTQGSRVMLRDIRRMTGWMQDASGNNSLGTEQTIPFQCHTIDDLGQVLASRFCLVAGKGWAYSHECTTKFCWACSASLNQTGQSIMKMTDLAYSHGCFVHGWLTNTSHTWQHKYTLKTTCRVQKNEQTAVHCCIFWSHLWREVACRGMPVLHRMLAVDSGCCTIQGRLDHRHQTKR